MALSVGASGYAWRYTGMVAYNNHSGQAWVYPTDRANRMTVFVQESVGGTSYTRVQVNTDGTIGLAHGPAGASSSETVPLNAWSCIQFKKIGDVMTAYLNAVEVATLTSAVAFTKSVERFGGEYLQNGPAFSFGGAKLWEADFDETDFEAEMYGYPAVQTTNLHTVSRFLTHTDTTNEVSGGVAWTLEGALSTNTATPTFLAGGGGGGGLLMMRRRMGAFS